MSEQKVKKPWKVQPKMCSMCGTHKGVMGRYDMHICRRCFKDNAERIGFRKYD
ncbi:MAG TPA: 30S ribosomal protein S14 [Candidatus Diapherotrites archaeon]|uniref:30S ribosomal protein S14 n=1 Tax=Candidatus Iainarchaeum sp. TaxID=3101447 RepID=A0A7J4IZA6_9ARCH|nr:30S ribosomal protein S14 [Candidatus Diapherotrites archaeon]